MKTNIYYHKSNQSIIDERNTYMRYVCSNCGESFEGQPERCPRCNRKLKYPEPVLPAPPEEYPEEEQQNIEEQPVIEQEVVVEKQERASYFDGRLIQLIGWRLLGGLVTVITLGICYPIALCWIIRWRTKHTVIEGRRLVFDGNGGQLIGKWILWMLLSIITLFIFALWIPIKFKKWEVKHTFFKEEK